MITTCFARGAVLGGILIALVAGTPSRAGAADALVAVGDELAVGKNRTGETCRLRLVESRTNFGGYTRYSLLCEGWTAAPAPPTPARRRAGGQQPSAAPRRWWMPPASSRGSGTSARSPSYTAWERFASTRETTQVRRPLSARPGRSRSE